MLSVLVGLNLGQDVIGSDRTRERIPGAELGLELAVAAAVVRSVLLAAVAAEGVVAG